MKVKSKSKKINKAWLLDHLNDTYVKLAKKEGYRARAAYKLKEIDEAFSLFKPGQLVVDLGAAPGAWSQYVRRKLVASGGVVEPGAGLAPLCGSVVAVDLLDLEPIDGVTFIQGDFRDESVLQQLQSAVRGRPVDVVISDLAPNLSGIDSSDAARVEHLVELAVDFATEHLTPTGWFVCKVFHGASFEPVVKLAKDRFRSVKTIKPKASRDRSSETFLVCAALKTRATTVEKPC
jgi:23S rRNA (uridine2552-2'-O)-methyltransferase